MIYLSDVINYLMFRNLSHLASEFGCRIPASDKRLEKANFIQIILRMGCFYL